MAPSAKLATHFRSISLPSKKNPLFRIVEEQLVTLTSSEAKPSLAGCKLSGLKDLYDAVDDLLQLPFAQESEKDTEEILGGSLLVLDVCGTTRDAFSQLKESIQELQSSLRRKRGEESSIENEVKSYMVSRKRLNKVVSKCLGNSKRVERKSKASSTSREVDMASLLKEAEEASLVVLESLLSLAKTRSRSNGWSLVSKLMKHGEEATDAGELAKMDAELLALIGNTSGPLQLQNVLSGLRALESSIQETEEELECVYRRLVKTRVSLLNAIQN